MAKYCPEKDGPALYLECQECNEKTCRKREVEKGKKQNNGKEDIDGHLKKALPEMRR